MESGTGGALGEQLRALRPTTEELLRAIARDVVCVVGTLEGADDRGLLDPPKKAYSNRDSPLFGVVSLSREVAVYKDLHGRVLEEALAVQHQPAQLLAIYRRVNDERPKSLLLDATWMYTGIVERTLTAMEVYDTAMVAR